MTPAPRGEVDELLEPVRSEAETHHAARPVSEGMPGSRACPPQIDEPWCGTRQPKRHCDASTHRARVRTERTRDQHEHVDTAPLLQECRSAPDLGAPNARTERRQMSTAERALSASLKERGRSSRCVAELLVGVWSPRGRRWFRARASGAALVMTARLSGVVVFSSRQTRGPHQGSLDGEGGQARLPRHLFAHFRARGAVRPQPSGAQSHTSTAPVAGGHADTRARLWSCPSAHAAC